MILTRDEYNNVSENLKYHVENGLTLSESIFRIGSDSYLDLINEARELYKDEKLQLSEDDAFIVERLQTGKKGTWKNPNSGKKETVTLDDPKKQPPSMGNNLFHVFRANPKGDKDPDTGLVKAMQIGFGERSDKNGVNMIKKHQDEGNRKAFLARHGCAKKKDQYASGWWSCNVHLFYKQLGLKTKDPW